MPSAAKASSTTDEASASSLGSSRPTSVRIVTRTPSRRITCPSSQPMGPPPRMSSDFGAVSWRSKKVSFVR